MGALALNTSDLRPFEDGPKVKDLRLAEVLGFEAPYRIRALIKRNIERLAAHGGVSTTAVKTSAKGGRPTSEYWLNEHQAYRLCMWSEAANANAVQEQMVNVFYAYRHGELEAKPDQWCAMERRLGQLEKLIETHLLSQRPEFHQAVRYAPEIFRLRDANGRVRRQQNYKFWPDVNVREAAISLHRQMTIKQACAVIESSFGKERTPSHSALGRFWKDFDLVRVTH